MRKGYSESVFLLRQDEKREFIVARISFNLSTEMDFTATISAGVRFHISVTGEAKQY